MSRRAALREGLTDSPPGELRLGRLSSPALWTALADPSCRLVLAPYRASLLAHPRARGLMSLAPGFAIDYNGRLDMLTLGLAKALRAGGLSCDRTREALAAEISHLVRVLAGASGDPQPRVRLMLVGAGYPPPSPPPPAPGAKLALVHVLAPPETGSPLPAAQLAAMLGTGGLPDLDPDTAAVVRLEAGASQLRAVARETPGGPRLALCVTSERDSPAMPQTGPRKPADVALVSMPFGPMGQPSLALSLLKSALAPRAVQTFYFNLPFARRIGVPLYEWITETNPFQGSLLGEWIFSRGLFPASAAAERRYLDEVLLAPTAHWLADSGDEPAFVTPLPPALVEDLLQVRQEVDGFLDACVEEVLACRPRLVGLTSVFQQHVASLAFARRLKARAPEVAVVMGGANCEGVMGLTTVRLFEGIDAVVCGEGEVVLPQIAERVLSGQAAGQAVDGLPGVYTRTSPEVLARAPQPPNAPAVRHLDDLPCPDFDDYFDQLGRDGLAESCQPRLPFETSRGCWWGEKQHCTFCGLNGTTMAFRSKSPERAMAELREVAGRHPGLFIGMADNIMDMGYLKTLLPRIAAEELKLTLFYEVKANLRKEEVRQLRAAGVGSIQPGIESLSDEVLRIMRKGVKALQNIQLLKWCRELGVWPYWNMLWGFPGEPPEEYERMADLLPALYHLPPPSGMSPIYLERFSPNFFSSAELGFAAVRPMPAYGHVYACAPEDLADLAYQFRFDYREPRDVAAYTRPLARRIVAWREAYGHCNLLAIDRGDHLLLSDTRPSAARRLTVIDGLARKLYLACDGAAGLDRLRREMAAETGAEPSRQEVEEVLRPLLEDRFLLRQGDAVLALAIPSNLSQGSQGGYAS